MHTHLEESVVWTESYLTSEVWVMKTKKICIFDGHSDLKIEFILKFTFSW